MRRFLLAVLMLSVALVGLMPTIPASAAGVITPQIQLVAASKLTYETQSTTVTGTVTYTASDGTTQPLANQTVQVSCYMACTDFTATTDANGHFPIPVTAGWWEISVTASIAATSTVAAASSTLWMYPNSPTRITATATPNELTSPSQPVTFTGVLQYQGDDGTWKPLPGRTVEISGAGASTTVTTAPDGTFTDTVALAQSTTSVSQQVSVEWSPWINDTSTVDQTFFQYALTNVTVTNPATVTFASFQAKANANRTVTFAGALSVSPFMPVTVHFEYSADGTSGWTAVASASTASAFSQTVKAPLPTAYYRAVVAAGADNLGAQSAVVKAGRTITRIIRFKVSATRVKVGSSFKITGTLQRQVHGRWKALAKRRVWILLRPKRSRTWYWYSKPWTNKYGSFRAKIKVARGMPSARWLPVFMGATGYYSSSPAKSILVTVV